METRLLKMFIAVAECGSLVGAGSRLHLTPSAVSHALRALEGQLGCRLFERAGKRVLLNQAGEQLLAQVKPPLNALEAAAEGIKQLGKWGQTRLRLGASAAACQHLLPGVIRELRKAHPKIELQVESGDMSGLMNLIEENKLDLALGVAPESSPGIELRSIFHDELLFVFAPAHPWANNRPISREEIRTQPLILYSRSSLTSQLVDDYFRKLNLVPCRIMEVASVEAIKELVRLELGVSVLAPWTASQELARGRLKMRPVGAQPLRRHWVVAARAGRRLSLAEESFIRFCRARAASLRRDRKDLGPGAILKQK
jgi:DNA-binding transcriptional LysR family regulator